MARLHQILQQSLEDRRITDAEVGLIRDYILEDGRLDLQDVKFLVQLLSDAQEVSPQFDEVFFPVLKEVILQNGRIDQSEVFYLLKMLYSDRVIRESELDFLRELRDEAVEVPAEFDELLEVASTAPARDWAV
jgi:hypothetical protein